MAGFDMRRLGRHGLIYGIGILLNRLVGFLMLPVYTRFMTPADYGILQLVETTIEIVSIVAGARLGAGIFHYYHKAEHEADRRKLLSTAALLIAGTYTVTSLTTFLAAPVLGRFVFNAGGQERLIQLAAAILAFQSLMLVPTLYLQVRMRSARLVAVNTARLIIQLSLNIAFVVGLRMGAEGVLLSTLISSVVIGGGLIISLLRDVGLHFSPTAARRLLRFGVPFVVGQLATFVLTYGDRYFLQRAADASEVGLYGLAYQFGFILLAVGFEPLYAVWEPTRFEVARRDDRHSLYARAFIHQNLLLISAAVGFALFARPLLMIITPPAYHRAADWVPIILVAYVFQGWSYIHNIGMLIRERTEFVTVTNWVGAGLALAGYMVLIPRWHALGAALATVLAFGIRELITYVASQRLWRIEYDWRPIRRLAALAAVAAIVAETLAVSGSVWAILPLRIGLFGAFCLGTWLLVLSAEDRQQAIAVLSSAVRAPAGLVGLLFSRG